MGLKIITQLYAMCGDDEVLITLDRFAAPPSDEIPTKRTNQRLTATDSFFLGSGASQKNSGRGLASMRVHQRAMVNL